MRSILPTLFLSMSMSLSLAASAVAGTPTHVMVRAQSLDAKFIGNHTGGLQVTLSDARSGAVLAKGLISGGTGDTPRIMLAPHLRNAPLSDKDTAGFEAVLDLAQPTLVKVDAVGPMGRPASAISVSSTMWIIPGHDVLGDGWVLTFPGIVIEPTTAPGPDGAIKVNANVTMMCGCPITPAGTWDANDYRIDATVLDGDRTVAATPLAYAGQPSQFTGVLPKIRPGKYRLRLVAVNARTPNTGVVEQALDIPAPR